MSLIAGPGKVVFKLDFQNLTCDGFDPRFSEDQDVSHCARDSCAPSPDLAPKRVGIFVGTTDMPFPTSRSVFPDPRRRARLAARSSPRIGIIAHSQTLVPKFCTKIFFERSTRVRRFFSSYSAAVTTKSNHDSCREELSQRCRKKITGAFG
jgi:hypothetical protein